MFLTLLKHDLKNSYRDYLYLYIAMIAYAILIPFFVLRLKIDSMLLNGLIALPTVLIIFGGVFIYFRNLFNFINRRLYSEAGYLTFSLPVSTWKIILSKVCTLLIWTCLTFVLVIIAMVLFGFNFASLANNLGFLNEVKYLLDLFLSMFENINWLWVFVLFLDFIITTSALYLLIIGLMGVVRSSLVKTRRYLLSVILFLVVTFVWGLASESILTMIFGIDAQQLVILENFPGQFMIDSALLNKPYALANMAINTLGLALSYLFTHWLLEHKLEL